MGGSAGATVSASAASAPASRALSTENAVTPVSSLNDHDQAPSADSSVQTLPTTSSLPSPSSRFLVHCARFDRPDDNDATSGCETDVDRQRKWKSRIRGSVHWARFIRE
ncbi:hypothetical protein KEM56_001405, partial [Ascosphaera pollenicola]